MPKMIYLNLPARDLAAATRFYETIGCRKNVQFSDHRASSMVWSETVTFQLLAIGHFANFAHKPVADAHKTSEVLIALTCDSRAEVDALVDAAAAGGGRIDARERMDLGWLYNRVFEDPDGHVFEAVWVDPAGAAAMAEQDAQPA